MKILFVFQFASFTYTLLLQRNVQKCKCSFRKRKDSVSFAIKEKSIFILREFLLTGKRSKVIIDTRKSSRDKRDPQMWLSKVTIRL